jgi:hypothetical protein
MRTSAPAHQREPMLFLDWELNKVSVTIILSILMLFLGINIINTNWYNVDNINEYYAKIDNIYFKYYIFTFYPELSEYNSDAESDELSEEIVGWNRTESCPNSCPKFVSLIAQTNNYVCCPF